jgi:hypothetical protein
MFKQNVLLVVRNLPLHDLIDKGKSKLFLDFFVLKTIKYKEIMKLKSFN